MLFRFTTFRFVFNFKLPKLCWKICFFFWLYYWAFRVTLKLSVDMGVTFSGFMLSPNCSISTMISLYYVSFIFSLATIEPSCSSKWISIRLLLREGVIDDRAGGPNSIPSFILLSLSKGFIVTLFLSSTLGISNFSDANN